MVFHDNVGLRLALGNITLRHLAALDNIVRRNMRLKRGSIRRKRGLNIQHRRNDLIFYLHSFGSGSSRRLRLSGNDSYAVSEHQRLVSQHLLVRHQQRRRRISRAVEVCPRGLLRQCTAKVTRNGLCLTCINTEHFCV